MSHISGIFAIHETNFQVFLLQYWVHDGLDASTHGENLRRRDVDGQEAWTEEEAAQRLFPNNLANFRPTSFAYVVYSSYFNLIFDFVG